jgi:hypothetical protein
MISNKTSVGRAAQPRWLVVSVLGILFGVLFELALTPPASANILVTIDKSNQQMSVDVDGAQRYLWPVSTGRPGYDTPSGTFKPNRMDADHFSQEWDNAPMPHAIFFDLDRHAIHGFFDVKRLGSAVSHGCVRLSPDHAQTLFNLVKAEGMSETKVVVAGRTPEGDNTPVARSHLPVNQTHYGQTNSGQTNSGQTNSGQTNSGQTNSGQTNSGQPNSGQPNYGRSNYGQSNYGQPYSGQPSNAQRPYPRPYPGQSYYGQSYYAQPGYAPPGYAPPGYATPGNAAPSYAPPGYAPPGYWQR